MMQYRDAAERNENDSKDVGENRDQSGRQHQIRSRNDRRVDIASRSLDLTIEAALPLNTMANVARSKNERYDQHDRIQLKADQARETHAPQSRAGTGHQGRPPSRDAADAVVVNKDDYAERDKNDDQQIGQVMITPSARHRLAGDVDNVVFVLILIDYTLDLLEELAIVDIGIIERGRHHRALEVTA